MRYLGVLALILMVNESVWAQFETFTNLIFHGNKYHVFKIKVDPDVCSKFIVAGNLKMAPSIEVLVNQVQLDPSVFLINAGITDSSCRPVGWTVSESVEITPLNLDDGKGNFYLKPNGALLLTDNQAEICESSLISRYKKVNFGVQSGPLLVTKGKINVNFSKQSDNRFQRCGVGSSITPQGDKFLVFAMAVTPVSFYEFSLFFRDRFKCLDALCLESQGCAIYFPGISLDENSIFEGSICNYIYLKL